MAACRGNDPVTRKCSVRLAKILATSSAWSFIALPSAGIAGDVPIIAPRPAWVKALPQVDPKDAPKDQPQLLILDRQINISGPTTTTYANVSSRVASAETLTASSTLNLPWHPDKGDLFIHRVNLIRGDQVIDPIAKGQKFSVLRREANLEQAQINGILTASMQIEGVQVGDVVVLEFSISSTDPALAGRVNTFMPLSLGQVSVGQARVRMMWDAKRKLNWRVGGSFGAYKERTVGSNKELEIQAPFPNLPTMPTDAPPRMQFPLALDASDFTDWKDVSRVASALYLPKPDDLNDAAWKAEVAQIAARSTNPKDRAADALRLVQEKIRYLFNGMAQGNYTPAPATETWSRRYGDCKAKTLLLLTLLKQLGIEAEPALVNARSGDWVTRFLPGFQVFDHIVVRAQIDGQTYWLDGTQLGTRLADMADIPAFVWALPLRAGGADLERLNSAPPARPLEQVNLAIDASAGLAFPAPYKATIAIRGEANLLLRATQSAVKAKDFDEMLDGIVEAAIVDGTVTSRSVKFDDESGLAIVEGTGLVNMGWKAKDGQQRSEISTEVGEFSLDVDRSSQDQLDTPIWVVFPQSAKKTMSIKLPDGGKGFSISGTPKTSASVLGISFQSELGIKGDTATFTETRVATKMEVPASSLGASRAELVKAQANIIAVTAPTTYPGRKAEIAAARKAGLTKPLVAAYSSSVASAAPDDTSKLLDRARFYEGIEDTALALKDLDRALAIDRTADTLLWRARLTAKSNQASAIKDIMAAQELEPDSKDVLEQLIDIRLERKEYDLALSDIGEVQASGGKPADMLSLRAKVFEKSGKFDEAFAELGKAIVAAPGDADLLNELCWMKATNNKALESALKDCTKAIALMDEPYQALDSRGFVFLRLSKYDDAITDFEAALKAKPDLPASLFGRGLAKVAKGDVANGQSDMKAAIAIESDLVKTYTGYGYPVPPLVTQ
jgi:tetratricopeptide (TPR) repeat protein